MLKKIKELTKDTAVYGISTIIGKFLNFVLVPFYTNVFNTSEFGIYSQYYVALAFLNFIYTYGMDAAFMKYSTDGSSKKTEIYSNVISLIIISTITLTVINYFLSDQINYVLDIPSQFTHIIYFLTGILFFDTLVVIPFANLRLERKTIKFSLLKLLHIGINLTLNVYLIVFRESGIEGVFISNLIASFIIFIFFAKEIFGKLKFSLNKAIIKKILFFGLPYLPASLSATMVQLIDVPIMKYLTDFNTVGIYRANYKLGIFMMLISAMFQFAWQPFFLTNSKDPDAKKLYSKIFILFLIVTSFIWVFLSIPIREIAGFQIFAGKSLIGSQFLSGVFIVPIILLAYIFHGLYIVLTAGIYIEEKTKYFPLITGISAIVNISANIILIPAFGISGAAISTLLSYLIMFISILIIVQKFYFIEYEWNKIFKVFMLIIIYLIIYYFYEMFLPGNIILKLAMIFLYPILLFILKVVSKEEIKTVLQIVLRKK